MRTYQLQGIVTALTSISHNGGELNGIAAMLRREKFIQEDYSVEEVPVVSGNAIRGILRDIGMYHMLQQVGYGVDQETGEVRGLPLPAFYFLFSGGALTSSGGDGLNVNHFRQMKELIPLVGVFGGAIGNAIMPGKIKIGKLVPICNETKHLLPEKFIPENTVSVWNYCQTEMYTRRDDEKNDKVRGMIDENVRKLLADGGAKAELTKAGPQQMMYRVETLASGTPFYWEVTLEDVNDVEFEAFLTTLLQFSKSPYLGGKSAVGHGKVSIKLDNWVEIDSRSHSVTKEMDVRLGQKYDTFLKENKDQISDWLNQIN